jgi:histidyl-tRNA synthetase
MIAFMMAIYDRVGITNTSLNINSVGDPESRKAYKKALQDFFRPKLNALSKISQKRFETNPMRILDSKEKEDQPFINEAPIITDYLNEETARHYAKVKAYLDDLEISYQEDPHLVRGLDYYTRTAFELISPDLGAQDALGGGGRYDLLIEEIGGQPTPAVGFAAGMERLLIACEALNIGLGNPETLDVYIVTIGDKARSWALKHLPKLRRAGVSATMDYIDRSVKSQMKDANRENARYSIIVGANELDENRFTLRNMKQSEEQSLPFEAIMKELSDQ